MWTTVSLTAHPVWDEVNWHCSATWREDHEAEPLTLTLSGRAPLGEDESPEGVLTAALRALALERVQVRLESPGA